MGRASGLLRGLLLALLLVGAAPAVTQEAEGPLPPAAGAGPDLAAWAETAARAEAMSEAGRGSAFALGKLRQDIVVWRERFEAAQAVNAGRIATVEGQIAALGPVPAEGEVPEDPVVAERREALQADLARLRAPRLLAQEAYAHADGLIAEIDRLTRGRQAAALLVRSTSPLDPDVWPRMADAVQSRLVGLWKEVTTSVRSEARREAFATNWPLAAMFLLVAGTLLLRGREWLRLAGVRLASARPRSRLRGQAGADLLRLVLSLARSLVPLLGLASLAWAVDATGLFGARATALAHAVPLSGACVLSAGWLARQFFDPEVKNPPPFDFAPGVRQSSSRRVRQAGWILAGVLAAWAFLSVGDIDPEVRAGLLLPLHLGLSYVVFRFGRCLASARPPAEAGPEDDLVAFRRRVVTVAGQAITAVAAVAPVLLVLGFHRAGAALLLPSLMTLALLGLLVVLQWLLSDLYALVTRRDDGLRDALLPVLGGLLLFLLALPVLALIWGRAGRGPAGGWERFLAGVSWGETRLSPRQFAVFGLVFALGWFLTRVVQGTLRATVLPRTRLDAGAQNAGGVGAGLCGDHPDGADRGELRGAGPVEPRHRRGGAVGGDRLRPPEHRAELRVGDHPADRAALQRGDWIEVGPRMGYVRDISVRSTRIETFDRTDVIVPNGDLVAGQVVNWTRGNLVGRIILPVSVAYGNDVDQVTAILRGIAEAHPMVLLSPPPAVVLAGFGADLLNFEIRAIIRDVNFGTTTRSEINQEIAKRFLGEGIRTAAAPPPPPPAAPKAVGA
jgi:small-conductance mechanosensitive channel